MITALQHHQLVWQADLLLWSPLRAAAGSPCLCGGSSPQWAGLPRAARPQSTLVLKDRRNRSSWSVPASSEWSCWVSADPPTTLLVCWGGDLLLFCWRGDLLLFCGGGDLLFCGGGDLLLFCRGGDLLLRGVVAFVGAGAVLGFGFGFGFGKLGLVEQVVDLSVQQGQFGLDVFGQQDRTFLWGALLLLSYRLVFPRLQQRQMDMKTQQEPGISVYILHLIYFVVPATSGVGDYLA